MIKKTSVIEQFITPAAHLPHGLTVAEVVEGMRLMYDEVANMYVYLLGGRDPLLIY